MGNEKRGDIIQQTQGMGAVAVPKDPELEAAVEKARKEQNDELEAMLARLRNKAEMPASSAGADAQPVVQKQSSAGQGVMAMASQVSKTIKKKVSVKEKKRQ